MATTETTSTSTPTAAPTPVHAKPVSPAAETNESKRETKAATGEPAAAGAETKPGKTETPTPKQVEAAVTGMGAAAMQAAAGDKAARREEGVFDGPVDLNKAFDQLLALKREADARESEYESLKEETSSAKKSLDATWKALAKKIGDIDEARTARTRTQPRLRTQPDGPELIDGRPPMCVYERIQKRACPICRVRKAGQTAMKDAPAHPDHARHEEMAVQLDVEQLIEALRTRRVYLTIADLKELPPDQIDELRALVKGAKGPLYPAFLVDRAHVVGAIGTHGAHCGKCGAKLGRLSDKDDYAEKALVGVDCSPDGEVARPPQPRGAKKAAKKRDPEAERAQQKAEGQKRAAKKAPHTPARKRR